MTGESGRIDRRAVVAALGVALCAARAGAAPSLDLTAEDGSPVRNFPVRDVASFVRDGGVLTAGSAEGDTVVVEFFDYNCGYCRKAATGLDDLLGGDRRLRLALVQNPILSAASMRAARALAAALALHGQAQAYALHKRLLSMPGLIDEKTALAAAEGLGLDVAGIRAAMDGPEVGSRVLRQKRFALDKGLRYTPTFVIGETGFVGWPGVAAMAKFIAASRRCGAPRCAVE